MVVYDYTTENLWLAKMGNPQRQHLRLAELLRSFSFEYTVELCFGPSKPVSSHALPRGAELPDLTTEIPNSQNADV